MNRNRWIMRWSFVLLVGCSCFRVAAEVPSGTDSPDRARAEQMVRDLYQRYLQRSPDPVGLASYSAQLQQNHFDAEPVIRILKQSPEYKSAQRRYVVGVVSVFFAVIFIAMGRHALRLSDAGHG